MPENLALARARQDAGVRQRELAEALGISHHTLREIEYGKVDVTQWYERQIRAMIAEMGGGNQVEQPC